MPWWEDIRTTVFSLESYLNTVFCASLSIVINDLVPEISLKTTMARYNLIDWEYSVIKDPMADCRGVPCYYEADFTEDNEDFILQHYFEVSTETAMEKDYNISDTFDCLWALWTVIKEIKAMILVLMDETALNRAKSQLENLVETG